MALRSCGLVAAAAARGPALVARLVLSKLLPPPCAGASPARAGARALHASVAAREFGLDETPDADDEGSGDEGGQGSARTRVGRPFLDPRAPRRQEGIRNDPKHANWGVMIDILEHAAYCDGQREEDPDGFFFDLTTPEYDSECDGDPFANGYLTEDEYEWPEEYKPVPPVPKRVADQIYFLFTAHKYPISRLCTKYGLSSERVTAILNLKRTEPEMIATGRYNTGAEELMQQLYKGTVGKARPDNWKPEFDVGVNFTVMTDEQVPDEAYPSRRPIGNVLRMGHTLPVLPRPSGPRTDRKHKSKFLFRDISVRTDNKTYGKAMLVSDWDGAIRPATNTEALYRSWETRYWSLAATKGRSGMPFPDDDANKPANFKLPP